MLRYQLISTSLGTFTPAQMGEFNLVYSLKKQGVNVPTGLSIYLSNKLTSIVLSAALALVGLCLYFMYDAKYLVLISAGGLLLLGVLFLNRRVSAFLRDHVVKRYLNSYYDSFRYLSDLAKQHQLTCLLSLCCLVIRLLLQALGVYLLFLAAHVGNIHFLDVVILFSMARFSSLIPFVLDVGILEVSAIYLFSKVGVGASATFNCYMTSRIINYAICALILALFYRVARTGKGNPEYVQEEDCSNHGT